MTAGAKPADPDVQALVDRHREQIDRGFYPCSIEMQVSLGEMYVADPRFSATYDRYAPGLARFLRGRDPDPRGAAAGDGLSPSPIPATGVRCTS